MCQQGGNTSANHIDNLFGAILISLTAVILGLIFLAPKIQTTTLFTNPKGILFAVLAGACALAIDFFALKTYGSGLQVSIGGPIIIGGSIAVSAFIGFLLGDSVTLVKVFGLTFIIAGSALLAATTG